MRVCILLHDQNLSHLPLDKMAIICIDNIFTWIFMNEKFPISIRISLKFIPKGPTDNRSVLVQVMTWRQPGVKPLPKPMLTQFIVAYMGHLGEKGWYYFSDIIKDFMGRFPGIIFK